MTQTTLIQSSVATPVAAAFATATTGGTLVAGTYYYRVSAIYGTGGETLAFAESSKVVPAGTSTNTVTVNWTKSTNATGYNVYGRTTGAELLIATVGDVATYVDDGSITPAGTLPADNTTGRSAVTSGDIVVAPGATVTLGTFLTTGILPSGVTIRVFIDTPGADIEFAQLHRGKPVIVLTAPGTYRVIRDRMTHVAVGIGVFKEA